MRDQYAGDVSDFLKFSFLRALAGADRTLGVAWYYAPGDDGRPDGRHLEWRDEPAWRGLDGVLHAGLAPCQCAASQRSSGPRSGLPARCFIVSRCRRAPIETPGRVVSGARWKAPTSCFSTRTTASTTARQRSTRPSELRLLRRPGRAVVFITFPGRSMKHDALVMQLHERLTVETGAERVVTLRTNVSVPRAEGSSSYVQRQRWFTVVDPDEVLTARTQAFAVSLASVPRVLARLDGA